MTDTLTVLREIRAQCLLVNGQAHCVALIDKAISDQEAVPIVAAQDGCDRCDTFGGEKTYANQVVMPLDGRTRCIDWCIHHIIAALNAANVRTVASCCGHGRMPGSIELEDGRVLTITKPQPEGGKA